MDGSVSNGNSLVIVAIPSDQDPVWKLSSEKVPHLTLAYLGDTKFSPSELAHVIDYFEHAASYLHPFTMDVRSRGTLGDKNADVLFFDKTWSKNIVRFRDQILRDPLISTAYNSTDQYPEWTPHLTMGYPKIPAKKSDQAIYSVTFDKVALWTGDYTGPTIQLDPYDYGAEVAMSQLEHGRKIVNELAHHGVKGMKWGVRKDGTSGSTPRASEDAKSADAFQAKIARGGTQALSNKELQSLITRMNLERQYSAMSVQQQSRLDSGMKTAKKFIEVGDTIEKARKFAESPTGKAIKSGIKVAFAAGKVGAAFYTGGGSSAASTAGTIAVRRAANHFTNVG